MVVISTLDTSRMTPEQQVYEAEMEKRNRGELLIRVTADHYVAALVLNRDYKCIDAAPILAWAIGKNWPEIQRYFQRKGYRVKNLTEGDQWQQSESSGSESQADIQPS